MSDQSLVFAYCRDTNIGAKSSDGLAWDESNLNSLSQYAGAYGNTSKFIYFKIDSLRKYSITSQSINSSIDRFWHQSAMPTQQIPCIVAIAEDQPRLYYSYDGAFFITGPDTV